MRHAIDMATASTTSRDAKLVRDIASCINRTFAIAAETLASSASGDAMANHLFRIDDLIEAPFVDETGSKRSLLQRQAIVICLVRNRRCLVIADHRAQRGDQHQRAAEQFVDPRAVQPRPLDREAAELLARIASHSVGLTLPGMIDEPGSFSGSSSSPKPQRGPEASQRISLAIFISDTARPRKPAIAATIASSEPCAANLLGAVRNGRPVNSAILAAISWLKFGGALSPVPTAVPPAASSNRPG